MSARYQVDVWERGKIVCQVGSVTGGLSATEARVWASEERREFPDAIIAIMPYAWDL